MEEKTKEVKGNKQENELSLENIIVEKPEDDIAILTQNSNIKPQKPSEEEVKKEEKPKKKRISRAEKRIKSLIRKTKELEAQLEYYKNLAQSKKQEPEPEISKAPDIEDFDDYDEYVRALEEYEKSASKEVRQAKEDINKRTPPVGVGEDRLKDIISDGIEEYGEDFVKKVQDPSLPLPQKVLNEVVESDYASDVLWYLANNKKEALAIANLKSKRDIMKAIVRIEAKIEQEEAKENLISSAPQPINPVNPKGTSQHYEDNFQSFEKYLLSQIQSNDW